MAERHELFDQLEAFDPKWGLRFATLYDAAVAANALDLYSAYLLQLGRKDDAQ